VNFGDKTRGKTGRKGLETPETGGFVTRPLLGVRADGWGVPDADASGMGAERGGVGE